MYESRCGVECDSCQRKEQTGCRGCLNMERPFWGGICEVKACCEGKKLNHCGECEMFPCEMLAAMGAGQGYDPKPRLARLEAWARENQA